MKKKQRRGSKLRTIPDQTVQEIQDLHRRSHLVYCQVTCLRLALKNGLEDADADIGNLLQRHVVDELYDIGEKWDFILKELGGRPLFVPFSPDD